MTQLYIAFLGYGEAARAFRQSLSAQGDLRFAAYDIKLDGPEADAMRAAMDRDGTEVIGLDGFTGADWVISAVTADQSLIAAQSVARHLGQGAVFIDINSVSPGRKVETAALISGTGGTYLDMAVMAPVHPRGHKTPVLLGGETGAIAPALDALGFAWSLAGPEPGAATAIKMIRSNFVKGLEAITVETLLAAEAAGVTETILGSLSSSYPGLGWPDHVAYTLERTLTHGARRAAEMDESAATFDDLGLTGDLGRASAEVQRRMGNAGAHEHPAGGIAETLKSVLKARRTGAQPP